MEYDIIELSRLRLVDGLQGFVEALQGEQVGAQVLVWGDDIRSEALSLAHYLCRLLVPPLGRVHGAQTIEKTSVARIVLNELLVRLDDFIELPSYRRIVIRTNHQAFPFAGVLP